MIQFNLLPDVKVEFIKAQRLRRAVIGISVIASAAALFVFLLLLVTVKVWQHKTINDLSADIKQTSTELKSTPDLNKILTVQSQLNSLDQLHGQKPAAGRVFGYMSQVVPSDASISDLTVDYTANTMKITGAATTLDQVNTFVDGLKFTKYTTKDNSTPTPAFSNVVMTNFSRSANKATFTIDLAFEPTIFSNQEDVTLKVPNLITTRSILEQPKALFQGSGN